MDLVEGLSGSGKSSVCEELIRRADPHTGLLDGPVSHDNFLWDQQEAAPEIGVAAVSFGFAGTQIRACG